LGLQVLGGHIHEYERSLPVGSNGTDVETHHASNASWGHYIDPQLPVYLTIGMAGYPHYIGHGREWPNPGEVKWSATHSAFFRGCVFLMRLPRHSKVLVASGRGLREDR